MLALKHIVFPYFFKKVKIGNTYLLVLCLRNNNLKNKQTNSKNQLDLLCIFFKKGKERKEKYKQPWSGFKKFIFRTNEGPSVCLAPRVISVWAPLSLACGRHLAAEVAANINSSDKWSDTKRLYKTATR